MTDEEFAELDVYTADEEYRPQARGRIIRAFRTVDKEEIHGAYYL